ncbi:MAG: hypothetical protein K0Q49_976 [Haloplasmataceae bacterium]|nr:hypothetical protein [Haloplasmataceae bacterium]
MLSKEKLNRLNMLAKKSKDGGLTDLEKIEQKKLREEYLHNFRNQVKQHLDSITIVDEDTEIDLNKDLTNKKIM